MRAFAVLAALLCAIAPAAARWTGPMPAGAPDKAWWDGLQPKGGGLPCCDIADGVKLMDVDWDTGGPDNAYRVRINGQWIVVPDAALVTVPNKFGPAVVWPYQDGNGATQIRCFLPGSWSMTELCFVADMYHGNTVDFGKLAAASWNGIKCVGVIHKASQGARDPDQQYARRRPLVLAAGLLWGAYAFNTGETVADQVAEFLKVAAASDAQTGLYLDFEDNSASEMTIAQAVEFLDRTEQIIARHCRLYSGNRLKEQIVHATAAERDFLAACPDRLWGCEYGPVFKDTDAAGKPLPWPAPFLWQDTGDGIGPQPHTLAGLEAGADLSIFKGTREQLAAVWAGAPMTTPAPAKPGLFATAVDEIKKII